MVIQTASLPSILHGFEIWWFCMIDLRMVHRTSSGICEILIPNGSGILKVVQSCQKVCQSSQKWLNQTRVNKESQKWFSQPNFDHQSVQKWICHSKTGVILKISYPKSASGIQNASPPFCHSTDRMMVLVHVGLMIMYSCLLTFCLTSFTLDPVMTTTSTCTLGHTWAQSNYICNIRLFPETHQDDLLCHWHSRWNFEF